MRDPPASFPLDRVSDYLSDGESLLDELYESAAMLCEPVRHAFALESLQASDPWRAPLDGLELVIVGADQLARTCDERHPASATREQRLPWTLLELVAAAALVAGEALLLLSSGYASGASTRWRTLFEIHVSSVIIRMGGEDTALRFLRHEDLRSNRQLVQFHRTMKQHGLTGLESEVACEANCLADHIQAIYEPEFRGDQGWAHIYMLRNHERYRKRWEKGERQRGPSFADLRHAAELDVFGPDYAIASAGVHATARERHQGTPNAFVGTLITGPMSGGIDPAGICIAQAAVGPIVQLISAHPSPPDRELVAAADLLQELALKVVGGFQETRRTIDATAR